MNSSAPATEARLETGVTYAGRANALARQQTGEWALLIAALLLSDVLMAAIAFRIAYWVRFEIPISVFSPDALPTRAFYERLVIILTPVWIGIFALLGLYHRENLLGGTEEYSRVFRGTAIGLSLVVLAGFLEPQFIVARGWVFLGWVFTFLLTCFGRFSLRRVAYMLRSRGAFLSPALMVGANQEAQMLAGQLIGWGTSGLKLLGFVDGEQSVGEELMPGLKIVGSLDQLDSIIGRLGVTELILASSALSREQILDIFRRYGTAEGINLRMSSGLYEIITTGLSVREFAYVPLVGVNKVRLAGHDRMLKLALDFALTIPALILLLPLFLLLALVIRLDSPGPVLHRRRVMGINGRQFDAFKFRTMRLDGERILAARPDLQEELAANHKLKVDPRVTRVGGFLRRFSLDELPQLLNVLRREMSLVGPRMISPEEMARYDQWGQNLLTIPPGITGLWQVSGRSDVGYEERVRLDMHYIRNWNIWTDLQLIFQTIPAVLKGRGAY